MIKKNIYFKSDGSDVTLILGFIPDRVKVTNLTKMGTANTLGIVEWNRLMATGYEISVRDQVDSGTTGGHVLTFGSGTLVAPYSTTTVTVGAGVYGTATAGVAPGAVQPVGTHVSGGNGILLTASGLMANDDLILVEAELDDISIDLGDTATTGHTFYV